MGHATRHRLGRAPTGDRGRPALTRAAGAGHRVARAALLLKTGEGGAANRWGHTAQCRSAGSNLSLNLFK
jgi:hypothetical protein